MWDTATWKRLCTLREPQIALLRNGPSIWSPDARWLIGQAADGAAKVWNTVTGTETLNLGKVEEAHRRGIPADWAWT